MHASSAASSSRNRLVDVKPATMPRIARPRGTETHSLVRRHWLKPTLHLLLCVCHSNMGMHEG